MVGLNTKDTDIADLAGLPPDGKGGTITRGDAIAHILGEGEKGARTGSQHIGHDAGMDLQNEVRRGGQRVPIDSQTLTDKPDSAGMRRLTITYVTGSPRTIWVFHGWIDPSGWR